MLTIYKASAGSGKTYTLAYQYIKMLLGVKLESGRYVLNSSKYLSGKRPNTRPHSNILAITFTNKATAEMKSRIIKELDTLGHAPASGCKDTPYAADLMKEYGCTREELAEAAEKALHRLLFDYGAFNISTIDSFFQLILRTFAREIDRQGDFRVELESDYAVNAAVSMLLDTANYDDAGISPAVGEWLKKMSAEQMMEGADFNPFNRGSRMNETLTKKLHKIFDEDYEKRADDVAEYLKDPERLRGFERSLRRLSDELLETEAKFAQQLVDELSACGLTEENLNNSVRALFQRSMHNPGLGKEDLKNYCDDKKRPQYMSALMAHIPDKFYTKLPKKYSPPPSLDDAVCRWFDAAAESMVKRSIYASLLKETNTLQALAYIGEYINRFRAENNLILIGDTNSLIGAIISEDDAPFIYERVGVELRNFLIDEFQDTSQLQWENLRPLLSNSLAFDYDSLIIGDVKQSIYRFRGADSSLLEHSVANVDFPKNHCIKGAGEGENTNYRSSHGVVSFNNSLFRALAENNGVSGYGGVAQSLAKQTEQLTAQIHIRNLSKKTLEQSLPLWMSSDERERIFAESGEDARTAALYLTGRTIMEQHARGYEWRDIAILCRSNGPAGDVIEYLMREFPEIKLMSEEALLLRNSSAVKLVISVLEIIDKSYTSEVEELGEIEATKMARRRRRDMMIDRFEYFTGHGESVEDALSKALEEQGATADGGNAIDDDLIAIRRKAPANILALVEAIIAQKISNEQRRAELAYITAFVDVVADFMENYTPTVHKFLEYWKSRSHKFSISPSSDQDAVSVMTVHKAKGLEWKCVHIPLMSWNLQPSEEDGWFSLEHLTEVDEHLRPPLMYLKPTAEFALDGSPLKAALEVQAEKAKADNLNVAYVAFTRAVRELHVNLIEKSNSSGNGMVQAVLEALTAAAPKSDIYMDTKAYTDELGNFIYGVPTMPIFDENEAEPEEKNDANRPKRMIEPIPTEAYDYNVAFTSVNKVVTQVEDVVAQSASDPDIGNDQIFTDVDDNVQEAARRGMVLHSILEQMKTADDLERALRFCTARLPHDEAEEYRKILEEAIRAGGEQTALWFDGSAERVMTEQPVYNAKENKNFRIDRIVWTSLGTIDIIDYKFTSEVRDDHFEQVRQYVRLLIDMGFENVRAFLWYPIAKKIVRL